MDIKHKTYMEH